VPRCLDIIIVSHNACDDLARCLDSLHASPPGLPHAIVVVDNASTDGSADLVAARWPRVHLVRQDANVGFARASNAGIRATRGELILLLNSDTLVPSGAIDALVAALDATPAAAAAGPRLVDLAGRVELSWGAMITPFRELRQKAVGALLARRVGPVERWVAAQARRPRFPDWVSGACLLVWRREAEAAGLLDERFFLYTEDVDFCAALRARGRRILYTPAAEIVHVRGRSRASAPGAAALAYRRSHLAFYRKHHPRWVWLLRLYRRARGGGATADLLF
jgi:N-acetylglucosaminyl-diphospho-decaprenol L-rhamnosyltransferase